MKIKITYTNEETETKTNNQITIRLKGDALYVGDILEAQPIHLAGIKTLEISENGNNNNKNSEPDDYDYGNKEEEYGY